MSLDLFARVARKYFEKNLSVIPCHGKKPLLKKWQIYSERLPREDEIGQWESSYPRANIGCVMGRASGLICLDLDREHYLTMPEFPSSLVSRVGKKGEARFFRIPPNCPNFALENFSLEGFDFISNGRQIILPPSIHPETGQPYVWKGGSLMRDEIPEISVNFLTTFRERLTPLLGAVKRAPGPAIKHKNDAERTIGEKNTQQPGPGIPGRNNRLKSVAQAILRRGSSVEEAAHEVWFTDLREHCSEQEAVRLFVQPDFEDAWRECGGRWGGRSREDWNAELSRTEISPLFLDEDEAWVKPTCQDISAARLFVESIARTEERRGLTIVPKEVPLVIDPEALKVAVAEPEPEPDPEPEPPAPPPPFDPARDPFLQKKGRPKSAYRDGARIQRPEGKLGLIYDECLRANKGIHDVHMLALGTAVSTMSALAQHRFLPAFGTDCTSSLFIQLAASGVGKTTIMSVSKRILEAVGFNPSQGWKSSADLQDELLTERNQVALIDEASSFFSTISQNKPHAVELQDTLTRLLTHPSVDGGRFSFATSKAGKKEGVQPYVMSPGITMVLQTTPKGLVDTAMASIGQRGFLARSHMFYQPRKILSEEALQEIHDRLGPSQIKDLCYMAMAFVDQNPIIFRNGETITTEKNYRGALSIAHAATSGDKLSVPLDENGPRQFAIEPRIIEFSPDAVFRIKEEIRSIMSSLDEMDDSGGAFESRFGEWASRLAFLNCVSREDGPPCVTGDDAEWGIATAKILLRDVNELMSGLEMSASQRLELLIMEGIKRGRNTDALIKASLRRQKFDTRMITQGIDALIQDGTLDYERPMGSRQRILRIIKRGLTSVG